MCSLSHRFHEYRFQSQRLRREVSIWTCLQHPNIIPLLGTTTSFGKYMAMVCPWMEDGNLGEYLKKRGNALSMHDRYSIVSKPASIKGILSDILSLVAQGRWRWIAISFVTCPLSEVVF